jgi:methionyl-tRNA formyltransferase
MPVDLYLGSDIGAWALDQVEGDLLGKVVTLDQSIAACARERGWPVLVAEPAGCVFPPAETALSIHYPRVFPREFLDGYRRIYNLHPGYLPWGRGYYPVFWALWEQTPAGATLHEVTAEIDGGPIVAQKRVSYCAADTGWRLHQRVREAEKQLFREHWPAIAAGSPLPSFPQPAGGSYHSKREFFELRENAPLGSMSACDLLRLAQAFTFPGCPGLELALNGDRFQLSLQPAVKKCKS